MNKKRYGISVVTYTYNDHELVADLLASIGRWDFSPREILVVDDGTPEPFVAPEAPAGVRVLRLTANRGPAGAKIAGLSAATGRFLLSLDADIRLPPDWATRCLPLAARPEVGLVATPIINEAGTGLLADYQRLRFSLQVAVPEQPKVMPAGLWLLRREVWERHGFVDYPDRLHEDVYFSEILRRAGLRLHVAAEPVARQVRRLSRRTMVRRGWTWQGREYLAAAATDGIGALNAFLLAMRRRIGRHQAVDPRFLYYDVLSLGFALDALLGAAGHPPTVRGALVTRLAPLFPAPGPRDLFLDDMAGLGCPPGPFLEHPLLDALTRAVRSLLPAGSDAALGAALPDLRQEDQRRDWHFSLYNQE